MDCNLELLNACKTHLNDNDKKWIKRKRKLNTENIFEHLMDGAITNTGISTCANFSQQCSHTAITKARKKLPNSLFFDINQKLHHRNYYIIEKTSRTIYMQYRWFYSKKNTKVTTAYLCCALHI